MKFVLNQEEDETEYALLNDDGTDTGISIQDVGSFGVGFAIYRHEVVDDTLCMTRVGDTDTLDEAKAIALKAAEG